MCSIALTLEDSLVRILRLPFSAFGALDVLNLWLSLNLNGCVLIGITMLGRKHSVTGNGTGNMLLVSRMNGCLVEDVMILGSPIEDAIDIDSPFTVVTL